MDALDKLGIGSVSNFNPNVVGCIFILFTGLVNVDAYDMHGLRKRLPPDRQGSTSVYTEFEDGNGFLSVRPKDRFILSSIVMEATILVRLILVEYLRKR